jgi:hypothetical protein
MMPPMCTMASIFGLARRLRAAGRPSRDVVVRFAESCARGRISKFQPCLPERLVARGGGGTQERSRSDER